MRLIRAVGNPFVLALLCLPTLLAVGLMTSAPLGPQTLQVSLAGAFVAFTIGSLVVAVLARAPAEIAGPTPSTTVIYAALGMDLANRAGVGVGQGLWEIWAGMSIAVMTMGALLLVAGSLRLGDFIKFLPAPVTAGFVTGIGLLVIWSQLGPMLGVAGKMPPLQNLASSLKEASLVVAAVTVLTLVAAKRLSWAGQPVLVAVSVGTLMFYFIRTVFDAVPLGETLRPLDAKWTAMGTVASIWGVFARGSRVAGRCRVAGAAIRRPVGAPGRDECRHNFSFRRQHTGKPLECESNARGTGGGKHAWGLSWSASWT